MITELGLCSRIAVLSFRGALLLSGGRHCELAAQREQRANSKCDPNHAVTAVAGALGDLRDGDIILQSLRELRRRRRALRRHDWFEFNAKFSCNVFLPLDLRAIAL
jgi:hypothetical protein